MSIDLEPADQQWLDDNWPVAVPPRCPTCGAVGTDPERYPDGRDHWTLDHLGYCRIGRIVGNARSPHDEFEYGDMPVPFERGDYT